VNPWERIADGVVRSVRHCGAPGGVRVTITETSCMGDTDLEVDIVRDGNVLVGLLDVPIDEIAFDRDGAFVCFQSRGFSASTYEKFEAVYDLATGAIIELPEPRTREQITLLSELLDRSRHSRPKATAGPGAQPQPVVVQPRPATDASERSKKKRTKKKKSSGPSWRAGGSFSP
jgi:hypothetical protein